MSRNRLQQASKLHCNQLCLQQQLAQMQPDKSPRGSTSGVSLSHRNPETRVQGLDGNASTPKSGSHGAGLIPIAGLKTAGKKMKKETVVNFAIQAGIRLRLHWDTGLWDSKIGTRTITTPWLQGARKTCWRQQLHSP